MRRRVSAVMCALIAAAVLVTWGRMLLATDSSGALIGVRWGSLRYFTTLSNLLAGGTAVATLLTLLRGRTPGRGLTLARWAALTSVMITLLMVVLFLGPAYGYATMFQGTNLWFHLIVPAAVLAEWLVLPGPAPALRHSALPVLPMLVYGLGYMANVAVQGPERADWYLLARGGVGGAILASLIMIGAAWVVGMAVRLLKRICG